jgi:UDP-N-acetylmuramoyl-L-alanyl-D-glutamate--2,6-diaminopimelate ligase
MHLSQLLEGIEVREVRGDASIEISGVTHDSRAVAPGTLFCCVPGRVSDGHDHAPAAVAAGAVALLCERSLDLGAAEVVVASARTSMGPVAAAFHGHPSRSMDVVGVTGTNGKTTTTYLLRAILDHAGRRTGVIGTLDGVRTTPEAPDLQARLAELRDTGSTAVAMEVSSHALALERVRGTHFRVAVFTNLTQDHLDFHASMEDYFAAKARLFEPEYADEAVVNVDDPRGLLLQRAARIPTHGYSVKDDVSDLRLAAASSSGTWRGRQLVVPLGGAFNVANALAALASAMILGIDEDTALAGLAAAPPVPGRFERIETGLGFDVVVDFAHTPDGVEQVLRAGRAITRGRVLVVLGAGGDKDRDKRPLMGEAAGRFADLVFVTSDNPRSEHPSAIAEAVADGARRGTAEIRVELDRRAAIAAAIAAARDGDLVIVAGKGHEATQVIDDRVVPFDDRVVVREELELRP